MPRVVKEEDYAARRNDILDVARKLVYTRGFQAEAKAVISEAAAELGGAKRLLAWAKEDPKNEYAFWATIYPKLLPMTVNAHLTAKLVSELAALNASAKPAD